MALNVTSSSRDTLVTVAIPTFNRSWFLGQTLDGIMRQDFPRDRMEVIVIDNNSPDDTRTVVAGFANRAIRTRLVVETAQGLDHARNRAVSEAKGEVILFADDDILVEPTWISQMYKPFAADRDRRIGAVGGEVVPVYPDGLPVWLADAHHSLDFRKDSGPLSPEQEPMGANLAIPRWVFFEHGVFKTELDRQGHRLFGGGDSEMIRRLRAAGLEIWFAPGAKVLHQMPASRLTFRYATRHAFDSARSRVAFRWRAARDSGRSASGYLLSRALANAVKIPAFLLIALLNASVIRTGASKRSLVRAWRGCGYVYQTLRSLTGKL